MRPMNEREKFQRQYSREDQWRDLMANRGFKMAWDANNLRACGDMAPSILYGEARNAKELRELKERKRIVYGCELICERGSGALARSGGAVASWSTKQRGLIRSKECGFCAPSKCVRINSEDFGLSVPALVRGGCTAMDTTCATAIRKALARNGSSATFAIRAG